MKKTISFVSAICILIITACNVGVKKDLSSGLTTTNEGLSVGEASLSVDGKKVTGSSVPYGSTIILTITGADGFTLKDGKAFAEASIVVKDKTGAVVSNFDNLFADYETSGIDPVELKQIKLSLTCESPIKMGEEYLCEFLVKDKNSKGMIKTTTTLKMEPVNGTVFKVNGLSADGVFYSKNSEKNTLDENSISVGDTLIAYFSGLNGFKEENGNVWIDAGIKLNDMSGTSLGVFDNLFAAYDSTGIPASEVKKMISLSLETGTKISSGKEYKAIFYIKDKKGSASLTDEFTFKIR